VKATPAVSNGLMHPAAQTDTRARGRGATASVGVASIRRVDVGNADARAVIEHLVDSADAAMYEAKRAGGNQTRQAGAISQQIDRLTS
jgi:GGDEF domain-containing protein